MEIHHVTITLCVDLWVETITIPSVEGCGPHVTAAGVSL